MANIMLITFYLFAEINKHKKKDFSCSLYKSGGKDLEHISDMSTFTESVTAREEG